MLRMGRASLGWLATSRTVAVLLAAAFALSGCPALLEDDFETIAGLDSGGGQSGTGAAGEDTGGSGGRAGQDGGGASGGALGGGGGSGGGSGGAAGDGSA